ncbi:hypothetical protein LYSIN_01969 [Lysinibacillus sphaericus]|uniref:Uncharacterized protein n=1 Tax=Lysinibacillus sphaericus TaxID=1421 RepID=A0A2S5D286_LYSSH|nr:hypothetical protein [Lysinibacillus sphaericus]POZ57185.1 hypothetical protein LYSIN_01969 [Lysinibacillus sphaericus]
MAIDLVAIFRMQDEGTVQIRRIMRQMDNLGNATRNATRAIGNQANQLSGLKSQIAGVAGAYIGVHGAIKAFNATLGAAANYEASEVAVKAIFNDDEASSAYLKMVNKMAIDSPLLNSTDMLSNSKGLVAMTKNVDELGKAWSIIERLQVLDPTQGTDGASFALKEMFQGDSLSMVERFGLKKSELNRIKKLDIPSQIREINQLLDGMGITQATVDAMGQTTIGYWNQIGERAETFLRTIGRLGNSKIGDVLGGIVAKFDSMDLDALAVKIDAVIGNGVQNVVDFIKKIWSLKETIASVAKVVGTFGLSVGGIVLVAKTIMGIGAAFAFIASPIGLIALGITGLIFGFKTLYEKSETFRNAIDGIGSAFKSISHIFTGEHKAAIDVLKSAGFSEEQISLIRKFGYSMKDAFDKLKGIFQSTAHIFTGEHKAAIDVLKSAGFTEDQIETIRSFGYGLKSAFDKVVEIFDGLGTMMMGGGSSDFLAALGLSPEAINNITSFVNTIKTQLGEVIPFIKEKFEQMRPTFEMLQNAFKKVQGVVMEVFPAVWSVLEPILSNIWSSIQRVADVATWAFNNIIVPGLALLSAAFSAVWSIIGPILELIGAAIKLSFEVLKIVWDTIIAPFAENLTGIFAKAVEIAIPIVEKIGSVFEKIGGLISAAAGKISNFAETLKSVKVPGWIGKIGSGVASFASNIFGGGKKDGSHYNGIGRIGWDGYIAELHAGERVLNRFEADQYDAIMGGEMRVAGVSDFKHEARSVNNTTINQNTTNSSGIDAKPTQGSTSISVAKLADQITVREDADITRIADEFVAKILEKRGVTV